MSKGQTARVHPIGQQEAIYRVKRWGSSGFLTFALPGVFGVLAPLAYANYRYNFGLSQFGPAAAEGWSRPWYLLSTVGLGAFTLLVLARLLATRRQVAIYTGGVELRLSPFRRRRLHWNEIAGISAALERDQFLGRIGHPNFKVLLFPNVGKSLSLPADLEKMEDLAEQLKARLYARLTPALEAAFQDGGWLFFGPLSIHATGMRLAPPGSLSGKKTSQPLVPWSAVRSISVSHGYLVIGTDNPALPHLPYRFPVSAIPNLEILLHLIQQGVAT